jgi:beta-glucanase (GH16 family)
MGALVTGALMLPSAASATADTRTLYNRTTLSVASGDGCDLKEARRTDTPVTVRQDFRCARGGDAAALVHAGPATPATVRMNDGDSLTVLSGDGCSLKTGRPIGASPRLRRDVTCVIKGSEPLVVSPPPEVPATPPKSVTGGATWRSIWSDEFTGAALDDTKWNVADNTNYGTANREDQCYQARNTTVADGVLRFTARRQTVTGCGRNPHGGSYYYFTSGMVTTRAQQGPVRMKFRRGYVEAQLRVPRGNLYWPAFWLVSAADGSSPAWPAYGEIDIAEIYGSRPDVSESNFYRTGGSIGGRRHNVDEPGTDTAGVNINPPRPLVSGATNGWHRYGIKWSANRLAWYVDGVRVRSYTASTKADRKALGYQKSIMLNLAIGGTGPRGAGRGYTGGESGGEYANGNLSADIPGVMEVDYVRVWQP